MTKAIIVRARLACIDYSNNVEKKLSGSGLTNCNVCVMQESVVSRAARMMKSVLSKADVVFLVMSAGNSVPSPGDG